MNDYDHVNKKYNLKYIYRALFEEEFSHILAATARNELHLKQFTATVPAAWLCYCCCMATTTTMPTTAVKRKRIATIRNIRLQCRQFDYIHQLEASVIMPMVDSFPESQATTNTYLLPPQPELPTWTI